MKLVIVGRGILGSSLYHMLRRLGHEVIVIESGERRVFPSLIHSLLLKGKDIELASESLNFYREINVPIKEFDSITLGNISKEILDSWGKAGVEIKETYVEWLRERGIVSRGGDRLVYISRLISSVPFIKGRAKVNLEKREVQVDGRTIRADKFLITAGPWNPCLAKVKSKSYYCWATVVMTSLMQLGKYFIYDYEKGFYSRPLLGLGGGMAIVGDGKIIESPPGRRIAIERDEVIDRIRERIGKIVPLHTSGEFCEGTPDMRPSYGEIVENIYYAGGLDGYGAEVGPGVAKLLINYIFKGEKVDEYFMDRFSNVQDFSIGREAHEI
ncbi:FAD-binding oxidoreductase [Metallosphaera sp.]|uniref:FAD-binding oxidoreductase n=1 Tax=Metallosphaera sp. TaxID=2020860 RepID=UPI00316A355D